MPDATVSSTSQSELDEPTPQGAVAVPIHSIDLPKWIGDHEILDEIARGGMGVVYRARQHRLNRVVALKILHEGIGCNPLDSESILKREAESAALLDHPGIVPIFERGTHLGRPFFTMAYVAGKSLAQLIQHVPMPARKAAEIIEQAARAMAYAHERGVVHLDLKPANILLDGNDRARVTDFGVAQRIGAFHCVNGSLIGTPNYMSPEQARGDIEHLGPLSDVYALGACLYACLTARPPFVAPSAAEVMLQVIEKEPLMPRHLVSAIPCELEAIALQALSKDPRFRYASATELADDLQRFRNGEPILARATHGWDWFQRKIRQHLVLASVSGIFALLLVLLTFALSVAYLKVSYENHDIQAEVIDLRQALETERFLARRALVALNAKEAPDSDEQVAEIVDQARLMEHAVALTETDPKLAGLLVLEVITRSRQIDPRLMTFIQQVISERDGLESTKDMDRVIAALRSWVGRDLSESEKLRFGIGVKQ